MTNLDDLWHPSAAVPQHRTTPRIRKARDAGLTRHEVVTTAIALADANGSDAISMRQLASKLDVAPMSLYWHVGDKKRLVELMLDAVDGEYETPLPTGDWRHDLSGIARAQRASLLRHHWIVDFMGNRLPLGPNMLVHLERSLAIFDDIDVDTRTALIVLETVVTFVEGAVLNELREARLEQQRSATTLDEAAAAKVGAWRARLDQTGQFQRVLRILDEDIHPDAAETRDERFEFGLDCVLAGISPHVD